MATAVRRHSIVNPARRRNRVKPRRANKARRHMSAKQIKHFGTKAQKAALKRRRSTAAKTNRPKARVHARRNPVRKPRLKAHRAHHRAHAKRRKNPGEILSLTLGNPARKRRTKVAAKKRNRRRVHATARRHNPRRRRHNPVMRRRHNVRRHRVHSRRRNPGGMSLPNLFTDGVFVIGGLVGSRLLTQMVLGSGNVGVWGYAANAAAGAALAALAHMGTKNPRVTNGIIVGTAAGIVARLFQDYTPFGSYLTQAGFGDYSGGGGHGVGLYLPSNAVLPQRYVDAANSAQVAIPSGWAPTTVVQSSGAGMGGYDGYAGASSCY